MLVLSRKTGQELVIGDNIRITVNRIGGSRVVLGISAPHDVRIVRGELARIVETLQDASDAGEAELAVNSESQDEGEPFEASAVWQLPVGDELTNLRAHIH